MHPLSCRKLAAAGSDDSVGFTHPPKAADEYSTAHSVPNNTHAIINATVVVVVILRDDSRLPFVVVVVFVVDFVVLLLLLLLLLDDFSSLAEETEERILLSFWCVFVCCAEMYTRLKSQTRTNERERERELRAKRTFNKAFEKRKVSLPLSLSLVFARSYENDHHHSEKTF